MIDVAGKTRAITYAKQEMRARVLGGENSTSLFTTLDIGFSPILDLPIRQVRNPATREMNVNGVRTYEPLMIAELRESRIFADRQLAKDFENLVLTRTQRSQFASWVKDEKIARVLRIVTHLLYSLTTLSAVDFAERHIFVNEGMEDADVSRISSRLPSIPRG